jgi:hypothetical protein
MTDTYLARDGIISFYGTLPDKLTSVDTYVDVGNLVCRMYKTKHFYFTATTNNLTVQILASVDGGVTYPIVSEAGFDVLVGTPVSKTHTTYYTDEKVQVKPKVSATHGTLSTNIAAANF